jgi:PII-like signaling protein
MSTYRIFTVGRDQHFSGMPVIVECVDDKEAVDKAMQLANGRDLEIWDHKRMVARLPSSPPKA